MSFCKIKKFLSRRKKIGKIEDVDTIIKNAMDLSMLSLEFQDKREQSLIKQSSQLLTAFSFLSAALLMLVPILISNLSGVSDKHILISMGITLSLLILSMVLALLVQWRYKYNTLPSPMAIYLHYESNIGYFKTEAQRCKSWIETINVTWKSKQKINNARVVLIKISMILFLCSIASVFISFYVAIKTL